MNFLHFYMIAGAFFFFAGVYVIKPFRWKFDDGPPTTFFEWIYPRSMKVMITVSCFLWMTLIWPLALIIGVMYAYWASNQEE